MTVCRLSVAAREIVNIKLIKPGLIDSVEGRC